MSDSSADADALLRVSVEDREPGRVYRLTIARPEKLNVLNGDLIDALTAALGRVAGDGDARAVVLAGAGGRAWIGGADIAEMATLTPGTARAFITRLHGLCAALRELPVPVVARIEGHCLGAGVEVAACCDLRIATPGSRFALPEVLVGIPTVIEGALLPRLIGAGRARDLVLTGRAIDAAEALAWGLVDALAPPDGIDDVVDERVGMLLSAGPRAVRDQKALCRRWEELPLDAAIAAGIDAFANAFRTDEPSEYMQRFINRPRVRAADAGREKDS